MQKHDTIYFDPFNPLLHSQILFVRSICCEVTYSHMVHNAGQHLGDNIGQLHNDDSPLFWSRVFLPRHFTLARFISYSISAHGLLLLEKRELKLDVIPRLSTQALCQPLALVARTKHPGKLIRSTLGQV